MDEKKVIEQLNELTKETKVPEKLMPENIMSTIGDSKQNKKVVSFEQIQRKGVTRKLAGFVSAAAVLIVATFAFQNVTGGNGKSSNEAAGNSITMTGAAAENEAFGEAAQEESYVIAQTGNVSSYDEVYKELEKYKTPEPSFWEKLFGGGRKYATTDDMIYYEESVMETAPAGAMTDSATGMAGQMNGSATIEKEVIFDENRTETSESGYSKTNVQTIGIDEADIIKTDGKYIYYASSDLHIVTVYAVQGEETEAINSIYIEKLGSLDEIYVDGDMLIATGGSYRDNKYQVTLVKYDITDRKNPVLAGTFTQEGSSIQTRKIGDIVYVITEVRSNVNVMKKDKPETFIPRVCDKLIDAIDIYIPEDSEGTVYTVISSVDVAGEMKQIDTAAVLGFNGTFYMGNENMYLYRTRYVTEGNAEDYLYGSSQRYTEIRKIDYVRENGLIGEISDGRVPGVVKDTFAVNEYNGYLRIMTTSYQTYNNSESVNNVFVLDADLDVVGSIEGLAKGERIYSARYMGDTAYFVTYRETDPLYSVDLSDTESPKIMGALKIPGFSEYLHGYGNGLLLGIGIEQKENERGWMDDYIKLSMFDISNPYDVSEEDKNILSDANYSIALYDYKSVMIDPDKNIFGFVTESYDGDGPLYRIFTYKNGKFEEIVSHELTYEQVYTTRSVYVGDYVYIVNEEDMAVYSIKGMCGEVSKN